MRVPVAVLLAFLTLLVPLPALADVGWNAMGAGLDDIVFALTTYHGDVIAGGRFTHSGNAVMWFVARWDGTAWNPMPGWSYGQVQSLTVWNDEVVAAGWTGIAAWDGTTWHDLGAGINGRVNAVCSYQGRLIAAGDFHSTGDGPANRIASFDGVHWSALGGGLNDLVFAACPFQQSLYAGGLFGTPPYIAHWAGIQWWWNGPAPNFLVYALAEFNSALYAGGGFSWPGASVARWDGLNWTPLGSGTDNWVYCLQAYDHTLVAGGLFENAGGQPASYIARWNGTAWSPMGTGVGEQVHALAALDGDLFVGGSFTGAGGHYASHVARWHDLSADAPETAPAADLNAAPNPFAGETTLSFFIPEPGEVVARIYDTQGRCVARLFDGVRAGGTQSIRWDGRDDAGRELPAGVFLARIATEAGTQARRIVIAR